MTRPAPQSSPTGLGRGARTRRVPSRVTQDGCLESRQPELGYSCVYPSLGRGTTPQTTHCCNKRELLRGSQAFLITVWGSGDHRPCLEYGVSDEQISS